MKFVLITRDPEVRQAAERCYASQGELLTFEDWREALNACEDTNMLFVDLVATLNEPHKIAGYEEFAMAKMDHPVAQDTPLVLLGAPEGYQLDFMTGWPGFVFAHVNRPVTEKTFKRALAYIILAETS